MGTASNTYYWTCVTDRADFAPRDGAGALVFGGKMWLLGGWNPGDRVHFPHICNSEVWSSRDGKNWILEVDQAPWEGRHTAGYVVHDGKMWIVGGDCIQKRYQNDIWNSSDGINWTLVSEKAPWSPRVLHHTTVFDGYIWVIGGQTMPGFVSGSEEVFYNDVWRSGDGKDWECVQGNASWAARGMIGGAVVFDNKMWLLGGGTYDTPSTPQRRFYNDVWSSGDGVNWNLISNTTPWQPRQYHDVAVFDGQMWVLEGWNQHNLNDVWHSADGVNWIQLPNTPWAIRHASSIFVHDNSLWVVAGNNMASDVWRLDRSGK